MYGIATQCLKIHKSSLLAEPWHGLCVHTPVRGLVVDDLDSNFRQEKK